MERFRQTGLVIVILAVAWAAVADEVLPALKVGDVTYTNILVTKVTATDVFFTHARGMGNVKLKSLSPEMQKHFQFDPQKAQTVEMKQAENKTRYRENLLKEPAAKAPDMSREVSVQSSAAGSAVWRIDYSGALKQARSEKKNVLLLFTGSDWCPACKQLEHYVLSKPEFAAFGGSHLQLVKLDFPKHRALPEDQKKSNMALSENFRIEAFPTLVLVNSEGRELGRLVGVPEGGVNGLIAALNGFAGR